MAAQKLKSGCPLAPSKACANHVAAKLAGIFFLVNKVDEIKLRLLKERYPTVTTVDEAFEGALAAERHIKEFGYALHSPWR